MNRHCVALALATAVGLGGGSALASSIGVTLPPPDSAVSIRPGDADYRIGPQDVLDINVFQVADLTRTTQVDTGGRIILPLVGQILAAGRTPDELSGDIAARLQKSYLKDPQVVVSVKEASSQKVTVDGAVTLPGIYALTGPTTLMQAVALAHGVDSKLANLHKVTVIRTVGNQPTKALFNLAAIRNGTALDPQIYGHDVIIVETSGGKAFLQTISPALPILGMVPLL